MLKKYFHKIKYRPKNSIYYSNYRESPNWGDNLNPWLFFKMTGIKPIYCPHKDVHRLLMAGSILDQAGPLDDCWGTGLLEEKPRKTLLLKKAYAVRGKLTARALENSNIEPPSVFGDPGLLVADHLKVDQTKWYKYGVIPHYMDIFDAQKLCMEMRAEVIQVSLPIEEFVCQVAKAEIILSSSLHGLICAESLGIPCVWIRFSDKLIGGDFKFHDYLSGTKRGWDHVKPIDLRQEKITHKNEINKMSWEAFDLQKIKVDLRKSFPKNNKKNIIKNTSY